MARTTSQTSQLATLSRAELRDAADRSRRQLSTNLASVGTTVSEAVDIPRRVAAAAKRHPALTITGAVLTGLLLAAFIVPGARRRKPARARASTPSSSAASPRSAALLSMAGLALREIVRVFEPTLKDFVTTQLDLWRKSRTPGRAPLDGPRPAPPAPPPTPESRT